MSVIDEALSANATIANDYDPSQVKPPAPRIAIVTCADPRLTIIEHMRRQGHGPGMSRARCARPIRDREHYQL